MVDAISSTKNPIVKQVRAAAEGRESGLLVAEGVRLVEEALGAGLVIESSLVAPRLYQNERGRALAAQLARTGGDARDCTDDVLARASALTTHQGVLALARIPDRNEDALFQGPDPFVVVAAGVRDPGNLGALVRTAEAAGATGLVTLAGGADPWREKAVRGSSGSIFRLPTLVGLSGQEVAELATRRRASLIAIDPKRGSSCWETDFGSAPHMFVLGSEAAGIAQELVERCDRFLAIPIQETVESLNVAVAAGVVLFEHRRRASPAS